MRHRSIAKGTGHDLHKRGVQMGGMVPYVAWEEVEDREAREALTLAKLLLDACELFIV